MWGSWTEYAVSNESERKEVFQNTAYLVQLP